MFRRPSTTDESLKNSDFCPEMIIHWMKYRRHNGEQDPWGFHQFTLCKYTGPPVLFTKSNVFY